MGNYGRAYDIVVSGGSIYLPLYEENRVVALSMDEDNYLSVVSSWSIPTPHGLNVIDGKIVSSNYHDKSIGIIRDGEMVRVEVPCEPVSACGYQGRILLADYLNNRIIFSDGEVFCNAHQPHSVDSHNGAIYVSSRGAGVFLYGVGDTRVFSGPAPAMVPAKDPIHARVFNDTLYIADYGTGLIDHRGTVLSTNGKITGMWLHDGVMCCSSEAGGNPHFVKVKK